MEKRPPRRRFLVALINGRAFLHARDALRDRVPHTIEWTGAKEAAWRRSRARRLARRPRLSRELQVPVAHRVNASPQHLFERLLSGGQGQRGDDWFGIVAPAESAELYSTIRSAAEVSLPSDARDLDRAQRRALGRHASRRMAASGRRALRGARRTYRGRVCSPMARRDARGVPRRSRAHALANAANRQRAVLRARRITDRVPAPANRNTVGLAAPVRDARVRGRASLRRPGDRRAGTLWYATVRHATKSSCTVTSRSDGVTAASRRRPRPRCISTLRTHEVPGYFPLT